MPKLEASPSREGREESGENSEEYNIPPLSDFESNLLHWRTDALRPLLLGRETCPSSSHELVLNGSQLFQQVYGSGAEASAFRGSVEGPFQFVTNMTVYFCNESSDTADRTALPTADSGCKEPTPFLPLVAQSMMQPHSAPLLNMEPDSAPLFNMEPDSAPLLNMEPHSVALLNMEPDSAPLLNMEPLQGSTGSSAVNHPAPWNGFPTHADQQSLGTAAHQSGIEDNGEVFAETNEAEGGDFLLLPPVEPSFRPLVLPIRGRRHLSV